MRASLVAEKLGLPSVSIVETGFMALARATAQGVGVPKLPIAELPGVVMTDTKEELRQKVEEVVIKDVVKGLATPVAKEEVKLVEPAPRNIIFKGTLEEVNDFFYDNLWTDGLPIIPPTLAKVEEFMKFTDRTPEDVIGVLLPENREATVWNVAVNGVMAGCHPAYMPILIAVIEAISDPEFRIQDAGSTPGWEPLIILNGPIMKQLNFNYEQGVLRVGRRANTSVGRFLRLYMRNIPGFRIPPGKTDKGTIAQTFNCVLAENEDAVTEVGWEPFSVDQGFKRGENVVTVQSVLYTSAPTYSEGDTRQDHIEFLAEVIGQRAIAYRTPTGLSRGSYHPLIVMSPSIAKMVAKDGKTKDDFRRYLYDNVKAPAWLLEREWRAKRPPTMNLCELANEGIISKEYCESTDPDRMVPVFPRPEWIGIVISGDPDRNQSKGYVNNHRQGAPVSKRIGLPTNWEQMLAKVQTR
ncbi:hypothetical protein ACFLT4_07855 [Chloroflexota bacterium]